jgi:hypothetical protein
MSSSIDDVSVDSSHSQGLNRSDNDSTREPCRRPIISSSLNFLSLDQKLTLAQGVSMASQYQGNEHFHQQPGAYSQKSDGTKLSTQNYKPKSSHMIPSLSIVDNRKVPPNDDGPQLDATEVISLDDIQHRMNNFQQDFTLEVQIQDENQRYYEHKRKRRFMLGFCMSIIVFAFVTTLGIPISMHYVNMTTNPSSHSDDLVSPFQCKSREMLDKMKYDTYRSYFISTFPNMKQSIDSYRSSANTALCWLSQNDKLVLNLYEEKGKKILAQRFIVTLLFFDLFGNTDFPTNDHNLFLRQNWLSEKDVCDWSHIECQTSSDGFRYVTSLSFSDFPLKTPRIPSEIALLQMLQKLNFDPLIFLGEIPSELSTLTLIEEFTLTLSESTNGHAISNIIKNWTELRILELEIPFSINLPQIETLTNLRLLNIVDPFRLKAFEFPALRKLSSLGTILKKYMSLIQTTVYFMI